METEAVNAAGLVAASQELNFSVWNLFSPKILSLIHI